MTKYIYDDCDRVVEMIDALGNSTKYTYDAMDRVLTVTDPRGGVTTYILHGPRRRGHRDRCRGLHRLL